MYGRDFDIACTGACLTRSGNVNTAKNKMEGMDEKEITKHDDSTANQLFFYYIFYSICSMCHHWAARDLQRPDV